MEPDDGRGGGAEGSSGDEGRRRAEGEEEYDLEKVYKSISAAVVGPLVEPHDHKTHQAGASTATHCC